jgi:glucose/arabinose dehydrogenase
LYMGMNRLKWMMVIIGVELVAVVSLLLWAVFTPADEQDKATTFVAKTLAPAKVTPVLVAKGLGVPTAITSNGDSTDNRLFVAERHGLVHVLQKGEVSPIPLLDITAKVKDEGEMGLLGMAFHPRYATNGFLYVNYVDRAQTTVIARYHVAANGVADPASEKILLTVKQPYANHNGGQLAFGPDGYLYIGLGDGGSAGDPENRAQDKNTLLGKILRIDIDHGDPYAIPADNPFVKQAGAKPEIWAFGLRNPWRFSFDEPKGDLYIGDVGQNTYEEIDLLPAGSPGGANFGWRCYEGTHSFAAAGCGSASQYTAPIIEYAHDEQRCSVVGGAVYRGTLYPALRGTYFYADTCGGQLYMAAKVSSEWTVTLAAHTTASPTTFGTDSKGELYMGEMKDGAVYHITDTANRTKAE